MTKASDNPYPSILIVEGTAPSSPSSGDQRLYIDSTSHHVSRKDSAGATHDLEAGTGATTTTPTVRAVGASASGTGAVVPGLPAGHVANDINVLFVQSDNQTITAPAGYTQLGPQIGIGTAAAASATRGAIFWKRDSGADTDPTVADSGDHTLAVIVGFVGCPTTGDPFVSVGQTRKTTASTTGTGHAGASDTDHVLVVQAFFHALDSASTVFSAWTNASLTSVTEQVDVATADGNGGGIGVATGILAAAGPFVATTVTETSTVDVGSTFYMLPADAVNVGLYGRVDRQVFMTPGFADTWTKPTGAKFVEMTAIGGGASGSAGRNAATAAGGGGGGGGGWQSVRMGAAQLPATLTVTAGAGGAGSSNSDGAAGNAGNASNVSDGTRNICVGAAGGVPGASATGSGGNGGNGGGFSTAGAQVTGVFGSQIAAGGTGGTTANAGSPNGDFGGGGGAGGGTTQAASAGGSTQFGAAGGGGGRANTNVGTGGASMRAQLAGGATAGANGADSPYPEFGGSGAAGGTSASGPGGTGGWPGGGGGGGGSQSGAVTGGKGGDGVVVITTFF